MVGSCGLHGWHRPWSGCASGSTRCSSVKAPKSSDGCSDYLGCCYLYPVGRRTELTEQLLDHDVDVSWWVTPAASKRGYYDKLYAALRDWLATEIPFSHPYYSNVALPSA